MSTAQTTVHTTTTTTHTGAHHPGVILHDEWAYSPRVDGFRRKFVVKNPLFRNLLSEFYGTFLLVVSVKGMIERKGQSNVKNAQNLGVIHQKMGRERGVALGRKNQNDESDMFCSKNGIKNF